MNKQEFIHRYHHARQVPQENDFPLLEPGRPAAVLIPIIDRADELTVLFTQRASHLKHHAGQVSFPGGKREPTDNNLLHTALRETEEEIGITESKIQVIGNLPKFRTISRYEVTPYVSLVQDDFDLVLDKNEVESVFEVPLIHLLDQKQHMIHWVKRGEIQHPIYFITWQDKTIWGATAAFVRLLSNHIY
jgi:8-oxo-dGTP pyrophosphatase MutT (NUDIX family)